MSNTIHATFILVLACLFALANGLPPALDRIASTQIGLNVPCTLLGKPFRRGWNSQSCQQWSVAVTKHDDSDDTEPLLLTDADDVNASTSGNLASGDDLTGTMMNSELPAQIPLPLVLNTSPESVPARLRLIRLKRPLLHSPCADDVPPSNQALSDEKIPRTDDGRRVGPQVVPIVQGKTGQRDVSSRIGRSKRLYDRGGWKSRLFEEY